MAWGNGIIWLCGVVGEPPSKYVAYRWETGTRGRYKRMFTQEEMDTMGKHSNARAVAKGLTGVPRLGDPKKVKKQCRMAFKETTVVEADLC